MLKFHRISKSFSGVELFRNVSLSIGKGERVGLIGRNGTGKSTLLKMIIGTEGCDTGSIEKPLGYRLGYLEQHLKFTAPTVLAEACQALPWLDDSWQEGWRAEEVLAGLGIDSSLAALAPSQLSGGMQIRLNLAKLLLSDCEMLLLDEPTNYLDILSVRWVQHFLASWPGELLLISHDRAFMDQVCSHTLAIHRQALRKMEGNCFKLLQAILADEEVRMRGIANAGKKQLQEEAFIRRFRAQANRARAVQSRIKRLSKVKQLSPLASIQDLEFKFNPAHFTGKLLIRAQQLAFAYGKSLLFQNLHLQVAPGDRLGIIGANGMGKTTLLNLLAGELQPAFGSIEASPHLRFAYFGQTNVQRLALQQTIEGEIMSALEVPDMGAARSLAARMLFSKDAAQKKIQVLSGGERSRVLLAKILAKPCNLLLLDEPNNHLDMESTDSLIAALHQFSGGVVLVSHSEQLLKALCNRLIVFQRNGVSEFHGDYATFLEKVGWQDEQSPANCKQADKKQSGIQAAVATSKRGRRQARAVNQQQLAPLKRKVAAAEKQLEALEVKAKQLEEEMIAVASADSVNVEALRLLSIAISDVTKEKEKLYADYEVNLLALEAVAELKGGTI